MRRTAFFLLALLVLLPAGFTQAQSGVRAVVVNDSANVRISPALGAEVIANVSAGYVFEFVTGRSGDSQWLRVQFNGDEGWVNIAPLTILSGDIGALPVGDPRSIPYGGFEAPRSGSSSATSPNQIRVTNGLRIRAGPGQGYPTLANMFANTIVPVFGRTASNQWIQ
ncbi:MAG: SH3 domain-containing protein, partial [Anaerolineae bacterium]|nr:SH3 domain-containing protein [Anaerolineae bacterium]